MILEVEPNSALSKNGYRWFVKFDVRQWPDADTSKKIENWIKTNCNARVGWILDAFFFQSLDDATLFKMTFS